MSKYGGYRVRALVAAFITCLLLTSCQSRDWTVQLFTYPPGSEPETAGWQYELEVAVSTSGQVARRSIKKVEVSIVDDERHRLLRDSLEFDSASIGAKVVWKQFDRVQLRLIEVGNAFVKDDAYNAALVQAGPRLLSSLTYEYDQEDRVFKRVAH